MLTFYKNPGEGGGQMPGYRPLSHVSTEIRPEHLRNTSLEFSCWAILLSGIILKWMVRKCELTSQLSWWYGGMFLWAAMNLRTVTVFCLGLTNITIYRYKCSADFVNVDIKSWKQQTTIPRGTLHERLPPHGSGCLFKVVRRPEKMFYTKWVRCKLWSAAFENSQETRRKYTKAYVHQSVRGLDLHASFSLPLAAESLCLTLAPFLHGE
jgi:hypothetical protein